jgi:hypothetical protein
MGLNSKEDRDSNLLLKMEQTNKVVDNNKHHLDPLKPKPSMIQITQQDKEAVQEVLESKESSTLKLEVKLLGVQLPSSLLP